MKCCQKNQEKDKARLLYEVTSWIQKHQRILYFQQENQKRLENLPYQF